MALAACLLRIMRDRVKIDPEFILDATGIDPSDSDQELVLRYPHFHEDTMYFMLAVDDAFWRDTAELDLTWMRGLLEIGEGTSIEGHYDTIKSNDSTFILQHFLH